MVNPQTLRRLTYFAAIADVGSIRGAAARLNLSVPVLSEALSDLEADLGVTLATRSTRRFQLTQAGLDVQIAAQSIVDTAQRLTDIAAKDRPLSGNLRVTVPVELSGFWLPAKIAAFCQANPDVIIDVDVTDTIVALSAGPIELAIRTAYVAPGAPSKSSENLPLVVVAASPPSVSTDGAVDLALIDSQPDRRLTATSRDGGTTLPLTFRHTSTVTNRAAALELARAGLGAVMVMRGSVEKDLAEGRLHEILPDHAFGSIDLHVHYRDRLPDRLAQAFAASVNLSEP